MCVGVGDALRSEGTFGLQFISYSSLLCCNNNVERSFDRKSFSFCLHKIFLSALNGGKCFGWFGEMYLDRKRSEARDVKKILFGKNRKFEERKRCEWNSKNTINEWQVKSEAPRRMLSSFEHYTKLQE